MHASTRAEIAPEIAVDLPGGATPGGAVVQTTVMEYVCSAALDGLFKLKSVGLEVGGVLFGRVAGESVLVTRAVRFDPEYLFGPTWRLSDADLEGFREAAAAIEDENEQAIGYFVSHTRTEPVLSEHNLALFEAFFPEANCVALVVKPHMFLPMRCVVHYRSLSSGEVVPSSEFEFDDGEREEEVAAEPADEPVLASSLAEPAVANQDEAEFAGADEPLPFRPGVLWLAAFLACAVLIAVVMLWRPAVERRRLTPVASVAQARVDGPPATVALPIPAQKRVDPPSATAEAPDRRVKELQSELERLKSELAQQSSQAAKGGVEPKAAAARKFVPPPASIPQSGVANRIAANPRVEIEQPPVIQGAPPAPRLPGAPVLPAPSPPPTVSTAATAAQVPASGRLLWTGNLRKGALLFIENGRASTGNITGPLPGRPVRVVVEPASLTEGGMVVHTADRGRAGRSEAPGTDNGWNNTAFAYDPKDAEAVTVIEAPSAQNQWRKLVLRTNRPISVVMISWHASGQ